MSKPPEAVVIGAGPAGLASAACLGRRGVAVTVLEAGTGVATSWRGHYARLHLHTVKQHSSLPGLPFPAEVGRYPSRAEVVAYLDGGSPGLYFVGFASVATGLLREIGLEAEKVAAEVASARPARAG